MTELRAHRTHQKMMDRYDTRRMLRYDPDSRTWARLRKGLKRVTGRVNVARKVR